MDLETIKNKFKLRSSVSVKNISAIMEAFPVLLKEINSFEIKLDRSQEIIKQLNKQVKNRPPLSVKGQKGDASWQSIYKEENNILYILFSGKLTYSVAKRSTNQVLSILPNLRKKFDIIVDVSHIKACDPKSFFHIKKLIYIFKSININRLALVPVKNKPELLAMFEKVLKEAGIIFFVVKDIKDGENTLKNLSSFLKIR